MPGGAYAARTCDFEIGAAGAQGADRQVARARDRGRERIGLGTVDPEVARAGDRGAVERGHRDMDGDAAMMSRNPAAAVAADLELAVLDANVEPLERLGIP